MSGSCTRIRRWDAYSATSRAELLASRRCWRSCTRPIATGCANCCASKRRVTIDDVRYTWRGLRKNGEVRQIETLGRRADI